MADDVVDIMRVSDNRLVGMAPPVTRHFMEIRGIGIVNIEAMYGISAVIDSKSIDIVISLEMWQQNKNYDRLGLVDDTVKILDVEVPNLLIPVHPGRQIAIIVEVAARNYRLKASGHHAAREMVESRVPQMMNLNEGSIITKKERFGMKYIGVDLGGTNIAAGLVSEEGKILAQMSTPTPGGSALF